LDAVSVEVAVAAPPAIEAALADAPAVHAAVVASANVEAAVAPTPVEPPPVEPQAVVEAPVSTMAPDVIVLETPVDTPVAPTPASALRAVVNDGALASAAGEFVERRQSGRRAGGRRAEDAA